MKALSVMQPWAWFMVAGFKDTENRRSPTRFRGRILIHASKRYDKNIWRSLPSSVDDHVGDALCVRTQWERGAMIGEVDLIDCVTQPPSPWFAGPYGFILANPLAYDQPVSYVGRLGLFEVNRNSVLT